MNAAQALFESQKWIFQPVDQGNDYGKDAYVDVPDGDNVTGLCAALQIKSGKSYKGATGYIIPTEGHEGMWQESPLPVMGIVYDSETRQMYWCNISDFLHNEVTGAVSSIPVSRDRVLNEHSLRGEFLGSLRSAAEAFGRARSILDLCASSRDLQVASILRCFRMGFQDPRPVILVRHLVTAFEAESFTAALSVLTHMTSHPDIVWGEHNLLPPSSRSAVRAVFRWSDCEMLHMFRQVDLEEWCRGGRGQSLYMLLAEDPQIQQKLRRVIPMAALLEDDQLVWAATYLSVYWAGTDGRQEYERIVSQTPAVQLLPMTAQLEASLAEYGYVTLF